MNQVLLLVPILLPILGGAGMMLIPEPDRKARPLLIEGIVILNSIILCAIILTGYGRDEGYLLFSVASSLEVIFRVDGMGIVFSGLVAFLWPLATLYALEYMEHDDNQNNFFAFYTMTYGVTVAIAFSGNLVTMYLFYEVLTLVTFPLVLHYRTRESRKASQTYLFYSIGGAACAFISMVFVLNHGSTSDFILGGVLTQGVNAGEINLTLAMFILGFFGFGVKAAVFPLHKWLPAASVAPTPVTALLHAVAVVKSGAFAILRLTYYSYGADFLRGTWAQYLMAFFVMFTIVYGSTMGVKEIHFKKRLAYSTISNLSYILLGAVMMCPLGLVAALTHLVFHAIMKICAFFCAGAVMHKADRHYVYELDLLGHRMPVVFACFTVAGLSLTGIPLFAGFISKWNIVQAALSNGGKLSYIAVAVLLYSAAMTGIYTMTVVVRAFWPKKDVAAVVLEGQKDFASVKDPTWKMLLPLVVFVVLIFYFGIHPDGVVSIFRMVAEGVL
ncbi:MAG: proton-conducting membrane transporter [Lachnospiraceae bacterium]|nr:proton-conducting membrane transporter [Lachnospiraceae bacterium]